MCWTDHLTSEHAEHAAHFANVAKSTCVLANKSKNKEETEPELNLQVDEKDKKD